MPPSLRCAADWWKSIFAIFQDNLRNCSTALLSVAVLYFSPLSIRRLCFSVLPFSSPFAVEKMQKMEKWALQQLLQNLQRFAKREMQFGRTDEKTVA